MDRAALRLVAAKWTLGIYGDEQMRKAIDGLVGEGITSPTLIEAYVSDRDELRWTARSLVPRVFEELGIGVPSHDEAWRELALSYARSHLEGRTDASETTAEFHALVCAIGFGEKYPDWYQSGVLALYTLAEAMGWVEDRGYSFDGTPGSEVKASVRRAAEQVVAELGDQPS